MKETCKWSSIMTSFLAGAFSGTCSTILFQPFELLKTRLQMTSINPSQGQRSSMRKIAGLVVRNESVFALWRGLCPSLYRTVPGIGFYFSAVHCFTYKLGSSDPLPASESLLFGAAARSVAAVATIPFSVVKTRFESGSFQYRGVLDSFSQIYRHEGLKGLSRGLAATLIKDVPFSSLYLMFYNQLKMGLVKEGIRMDKNPGIFFMCGSVAGCMASFVTHPPDVVKTRLQLYPDRFSNSWQACVHILKNDGLRGFFRGLVPRLIRRTLMTALSWTVYEEAMIYLKLKR